MDENVRPVRWVGSALRGGSSFNDPRNFRAACRVLEPTGKTNNLVDFRVARTLTP